MLFAATSQAYERVVLLAPAAGDLLQRLGQAHKVVGVTRANEDFPHALKVGSHIKPNLELVRSLNPDLIVLGSERFFTSQMQSLVGAKTLIYNPVTLDGVLDGVAELGEALECQPRADQLVAELSALRQQLRPVLTAPGVIFEVTEMPLTIAGQGNIVADIIGAAGGKLLAPSGRKLIKFSPEAVLMNRPDLYIYQVGPMNRSPSNPLSRPHYARLKARAMAVDQLAFSRANGHSFDLALELNRLFLSEESSLETDL
ncbi:ABC transporter substrate-binding protein [Ferrimonas sp.]|uniref:ABC transporter substrate-binding protein n=1 Tax=Ferrimonas sp. TaxID=2080861 RepID=UPI003A9484E1